MFSTGLISPEIKSCVWETVFQEGSGPNKLQKINYSSVSKTSVLKSLLKHTSIQSITLNMPSPQYLGNLFPLQLDNAPE